MLKNRANQNIYCGNCAVNNLCLTRNLNNEEIRQIDGIISKVKILAKGEHVFHAQDEMDSLYAVHAGSFKDYWLDENGNERIDNFYLPGDIIGLESIANRKHLFSLVALEDSELCIVPIDDLFELMFENKTFMTRIMDITSYKMQNDKQIPITTNASQRVADFILNILNRMKERAAFYDHISLPMSQLDISYCLGMAYETVNRVLKRLQKETVIKLINKKIYIINFAKLKELGTPIPSFNQV